MSKTAELDQRKELAEKIIDRVGPAVPRGFLVTNEGQNIFADEVRRAAGFTTFGTDARLCWRIGWGVEITLSFTLDGKHVVFSWSGTQRDLADAVAFASLLTELSGFAAKLKVCLEELNR